MAMQEIDFDTTLKVIVVGNGCVGKTSMITRYARSVMTDNYKKTIGTDFQEKDIKLPSGESLRLYLWDTAGQEMFAKLTKAYYKGAGAVVYAFSTTDRDSFLEIENWKRKVEEECGQICSVLVQNKTDLIAQATMTSAEVEELSKRIGVKLYRICVKDNLLVSDVFEYLATQYLAKGGAAISSDNALMSIESGAADRKGAPAEANGANAAANGSAAAAGGSAAAPATVDTSQAANNKPFTLEPSTQRTGGKKSACACG